MIIVCCPVRLWPATRDSLARYAPGAQIIPVAETDIGRPWDTYAARWGTDDLMIAEQDVILHQDVIPQFTRCPEPWCLFPGRHHAQGGGWMADGLLCTRFRRQFQEAVPARVIEAVPASCHRCDGTRRDCWAHLDGRIREAGEAAGFRIHVHWPSVGHRDFPPGGHPEPQ